MSERYEVLKKNLEERRQEILSDIRQVKYGSREERAGEGVVDEEESMSRGITDDIEFALVQMRSHTLHRVEEALGRLENGTYGYCFECGGEISERRLRALPFAVRCRDCEEANEVARQREHALSRRKGSSLFLDMSN